MGKAILNPIKGVDYFEVYSTVVSGITFQGIEAELRKEYSYITDDDVAMAKECGTDWPEIAINLGRRCEDTPLLREFFKRTGDDPTTYGFSSYRLPPRQ